MKVWFNENVCKYCFLWKISHKKNHKYHFLWRVRIQSERHNWETCQSEWTDEHTVVVGGAGKCMQQGHAMWHAWMGVSRWLGVLITGALQRVGTSGLGSDEGSHVNPMPQTLLCRYSIEPLKGLKQGLHGALIYADIFQHLSATIMTLTPTGEKLV